MKEINIEVPEGFIIDEENSSFTCIKFKKEEKKQVTCWEDLEKINGYYLGADSKPVKITDYPLNLISKQVFATKEQAEACIALAMLSQLMKDVNKDWIPDWKNLNEEKYFPYIANNIILSGIVYAEFQHVAFKSYNIYKAFIENHEDLLRQYFEMD